MAVEDGSAGNIGEETEGGKEEVEEGGC